MFGERITSNFQARPLMYASDLPEKVQEDLGIRAENDGDYFKYKGEYYDLADFLACDSFDGYWHGSFAQSFFSGILVRLTDDNEGVIVGTWSA